MTMWDYTVTFIPKVTADAIISTLNQFGDEGWELVAIDFEARVFYFKRQVIKKDVGALT